MRLIFLTMIVFIVLSLSAEEVILQNNASYSGCEDTHLRVSYSDLALTDMISDSQTNYSQEDKLHLSR